MKSLLVLRHAKSSWKKAGLPDHDRPLNKRGKRDAPAMGRLMLSENLVPELILSSSAVRARTTALLASEATGAETEIRLLGDLYLASPKDYVRILASLSDRFRRVMIVGHNPGLEELVESLTAVREILPTAALAQIELPIDRWDELDTMPVARLVRIWRPKELAPSPGP